MAGSPPRFDFSCASRGCLSAEEALGTIRARTGICAMHIVWSSRRRTYCRALLYVRVWMQHVVLGGESVWPQSPTGRCWTRRAGCGLTGVDRLVLPLAAPVTRFRTPSSQRAGSQTLAHPTTARGLDPPAALAPCFPAARLWTWGRDSTDPAPGSGALDTHGEPHRRPLLIAANS